MYGLVSNSWMPKQRKREPDLVEIISHVFDKLEESTYYTALTSGTRAQVFQSDGDASLIRTWSPFFSMQVVYLLPSFLPFAQYSRLLSLTLPPIAISHPASVKVSGDSAVQTCGTPDAIPPPANLSLGSVLQASQQAIHNPQSSSSGDRGEREEPAARDADNGDVRIHHSHEEGQEHVVDMRGVAVEQYFYDRIKVRQDLVRKGR
jgi:hypothetical protein